MKPKGRLEEFRARMKPVMKELKFTLGRVKKSPLSIIGIAIIIFFAVLAVMAPILAPIATQDPYRMWRDSTQQQALPPGSPINRDLGGPQALKAGYPSHLLGSIDGYDIYYGIIWGSQVAFRIGFIVVALTLIIGVALGTVSAYYGGVIDELMMRFTDIIFAFPGLILAMAFVLAIPIQFPLDVGFWILLVVVPVVIALVVSKGFKLSTLWSTIVGIIGLVGILVAQFVFKFSIYPMVFRLNNLDKVLIALVIVGWPGYTRVIRGEILRVKQEDYVEAAKAVGCSDLRIMSRHILPNSIYPILIIASLDIGSIVLLAAALSFLGIGAPEGYTDWGYLISLSQNYIWADVSNPWRHWYTFVIPGVFIAMFTLGWNLLGDAFRDILDPTLRRK